MSQTESGLEQYRSSHGIKSKTADLSSDDHALKQRFGGDDSQKSFQFDPEIIAERISDWYDSDGAAIREFLSNAETACIRRAKMELKNAGESVPTDITDIVEEAKEKCGYEPLIEVTYNRKADDTRFIVEDNGCGITTEEYQVLRNIGYSASHGDGELGDGFGMGIMSFAQLTGTEGFLKFDTRSYPGPDREECAYSVAMYITNLEFLNGEPDEYGTRFEFPDFTGDAKNIDIPSKVEEFAQGMVVPVLYRDFDESGQETSKSDDYLATRIEDMYPDDSLVVTFENEFFKAVMSPDNKEDRRGLITYNISMPIRRNTDGFGSNNAYGAPWKWDFRGKKEDGPIVHCPSDESVVGLIPKEDTKYDRLMEDFQEKCIPMSQVPDDAVSMPQPASSRDSFKSGNNDFWKHVSDRLTKAWAEIARERFEQLDSWDDFLSMDREEKEALFRAYDEFGPKYSETESETIQETLEDELGVTLDLDLCKKLHESKKTVRVVKRGNSRAHTKKATKGIQIWKLIDRAPDGIYMAKTVSQKKAEIVWGLGETDIVRLEDETYSELADMWGWEKAKDLPTRNLAEKLPELDQDVIDEYENKSASDSNNTKSTSNTGGNGKDPETYWGKVRVGSNSRKYCTTHKMDNLVDTLEDDDVFSVGRYSAKYLILHDTDTSARDVARSASRGQNIGALRAPKYVYEYLVTKPNVYESKTELYKDQAGATVELRDGTTADIRDLSSDELLLCVGSKTEDRYDDRRDELADILGYDPGDYDQISFIDASDLDGSWDVSTDASVVKMAGGGSFEDFNDYSYESMKFADIKFEELTAGMDESSDEYKALFGYRYGEPEDSTLETLVDIAEQAGLTD